ncbi:MAG: hypothetical protein KDA58_07245 [Planctomycetaceae bacterium]|nr:hypothetical protein [Planctomycetaceae bacterium]
MAGHWTHWHAAHRLFVAACLVCCCAGCKSVFIGSAQHPRSLEELYFEAQAARGAYPENSGAVATPGAALLPGQTYDYGLPPLPDQPVDYSPAYLSPGHVPNYSTSSHTPSVRRPASPTVQQASHLSGASTGGVRRVSATNGPGGPLVSEIFEDTDVRQAVQALAVQAGVSVIMDDRVGGVTTAYIENEPFEFALRKLLLPLGLIYRYRDGQYLIGSTDPTTAMFPLLAETREFRPLHLAPQELLPLLPERLQQYVRVVEKRNLMIVEAPPDVTETILQQLQQADEPVPQVVLEAIVCVFQPDEKFQFNINGGHSLVLNGQEVLNLGLTGLAMTGNGSPIGVSNAFSDFAVTSTFLRLLAQEGYVTIRAAPRVMAKDGEKATISISRETFFSTQPLNADIVFTQNIKQVDAGITLDIVPVIRGDNVTVTIEKAEVSENITQSDVNEDLTSPFPLINRRQVATTVHVKDGETIVIGGLTQRQTIDRISQIPVLCNIPGLGKLFQRIEKEDAEAEVAIFISPKIIRSPHCPQETLPAPQRLQQPQMFPQGNIPPQQPQLPVPTLPSESSLPQPGVIPAQPQVIPQQPMSGGTAPTVQPVQPQPSTSSIQPSPAAEKPSMPAPFTGQDANTNWKPRDGNDGQKKPGSTPTSQRPGLNVIVESPQFETLPAGTIP